LANNLPQILQPKEAYTFDYPWAIELAEMQQDILWTEKEIAVEKDIQDIKVNMSESEAHGVITTLKLFTLYELKAGVDYWGGRIMQQSQRPDIQRLASTISFTELGVHGPFYNKLNEALNLNTDEFYLSYKDDPLLNARMQFVKESIADEDPLLSAGVFSMVEGAVLYSAFAFLMHFQSAGKNKLMNVVRGIKFSVRDENIHSLAGAAYFKQLAEESGRLEDMELKAKLITSALQIQEHEHEIIDLLFSKGEMEGITANQMKIFVNHRLNLCLANLGVEPQFDEEHNVIKEWFYDGINAVQLHDFFTGTGNSYNRDWNEDGFSWEVDETKSSIET
jgi:ribonucleotide reductase beta subunit family protein with ferritin-like domain